MIVHNLGSCFRLLESCKRCKHREEASIRNFKGLVRIDACLYNAYSTFAILMERVLKRLRWNICLFYLVDVIVMARTFEKELERLKEVFERLARAGLKLKPNKCFLFQKWVSRLGHVIIEEGIAADPEKVEQVFTWPNPENSTDRGQKFSWTCLFHCLFVPDFSTTAKPLYKLTETKTELVWTDKCDQLAFDRIKGFLTFGSVLVYLTRDGKFVLDTDASDHGISAALSQFQDGQEKPIAFATVGH